MSDDLHALDFLPTVDKIDVLDKEKATFHPLEGNVPIDIWTRHFPCADQSIQTLEVGIWRSWLLLSLSKSTILWHTIFSSCLVEIGTGSIGIRI
jgi:hypothetical protein